MRIAVIGMGNVGGALGSRFAEAGGKACPGLLCFVTFTQGSFDPARRVLYTSFPVWVLRRYDETP